MKIIKRNGSEAVFDITKIIRAISKANETVDEGIRMTPTQIRRIAERVVLACEELGRSPGVEEVQDMVEQQIMAHGAFEVARSYITYRYTRNLVRQSNTTDDKILSLIECNNEEAKQENSNKNPIINSTQRDYMAGEISRDITNRILLPADIVKAHNEGIIHFHDADYFIQPIFNCCLVNIKDMLDNGTVMNGKLIESPKSFQVACTVMTQIISAVASSQYGGQSVDIRHLGKYLRKSADKYRSHYKEVYGGKMPDEVIEEVKISGLRGRGGAGFPTGKKWEFTRIAKGDQKYVVCNADEGDPGAFMDRSILEGDPHCIIEAMMIAGYAIGADKGYIYVRAEYPIAVKRFQKAIDQAREYGILGQNIWGTGFNFDLEIRLGAGAFVCGEETALLESIEGRRGQPRLKPPFPANAGLWQKPTLINNVETYANITKIILNGADWFKGIGTETSKGTKVFALGGNVVNIGLVEVPMGTTLREIIYDIGGGIKNGKKFKAVQTGGPSGGCLTEEHLDLEMDYDNLIKAGAMVGSGGLVVMNEDTCIVEVARFFMNFTQNESCGKCVPCREGTKRMLGILERIVAGMCPTGTVTWNETIRCPVDATRATLFHLKRCGERVARRR